MSAPDRRGPGWVWFVIALAGALSACLWIFVLRNYYLKPYSDPLNYLHYANHLRTEFFQSRWAVGYPLFLWIALRVLGPFTIFLVNLPFLNLLFLEVALFTALAARETERPMDAALVGLGAFALILGFDPSLTVYLTNPYRDPLALLYAFGAALAMLAYVRRAGHPAGWLAMSGLLMGGAYAIREPTVLTVGPLLLFALQAWRRDPTIRFWKSALIFGVAMALGGLPVLTQSYVVSGQIILPPQSARDGLLVPGLIVTADVFRRVSQAALTYYLNHAGVLLAAFGFGAVFALRQRNRTLSWIALPAALGYIVFYSFYHPFFRRYFYIATLFGATIAAYGLYSALALGLRLCRLARFKTPAYLALSLGLAVVTAGRLLAIRPLPQFRIPEARRLIMDLQHHLPRGATVLAPRHLCEVLRYFLAVRSLPVHHLSSDEVPVDRGLVRELTRLTQPGAEAYLAEVFAPQGRTDGGGDLARQYVRLEPLAVFTNALYNLQAICGYHDGFFVLHRLKPWTETAAEQRLDASPEKAEILQVDAKILWHEATPRTFARLRVNDRVLTDSVRNGLNYFRLPPDLTRPLQIRLESDQPVPDDLAPVLRSVTAPLDFSLKPDATPSALSLLVPGEWRKTGTYFSWYGFVHRAAVNLPVAWAEDETFLVECRLRAAKKGGPPLRLQVQDEETGDAAVRELPRDGAFYSLCLHLQGVRGQEQRKLWIEKVASEEQGDSVVEIGRVSAYPLFRGRPVEMDLGVQHDAPFVAAGWHNREMTQGTSFRWTTAEALLTVFLPPGAGDQVLRLFCSDRSRPAQAPPVELRLAWNGRPLEYRVRPEAGENGFKVLEADLPAAWLQAPSNSLVLRCTPWTPRDFGRKDSRFLGVMVDRVLLCPVASGSRPSSPASL